MEQEKYLSEEKYQETNKKVKKTSKTLLIIGAILLVIGIIMVIAGFISFKNAQNKAMNSFNNSASNLFDSFNNSINNDYDGEAFVNSMKESVTSVTSVTDSSNDSFTSIGLFALGGFVSSAGVVLLIVGGVMTYMAHRREITAYTTQQTIPIKKETINDITPTVADAAGTVAKSVSQGFEEGKKETDDTQNKVN